MKARKQIFQVCMVVFFTIGVLGFLGGFIIDLAMNVLNIQFLSTTVQFPNSFDYPNNLLVDGEGSMFCYTRS